MLFTRFATNDHEMKVCFEGTAINSSVQMGQNGGRMDFCNVSQPKFSIFCAKTCVFLAYKFQSLQ